MANLIAKKSFGAYGTGLSLSVVGGAAVAIPLLVVYASWFLGIESNLWTHLIEYNLWHYTKNSLTLTACVMAGALVLGLSLAYLVTHYDFFGRRVLKILLFLPMAFPSYVLGFVLVGASEWGGFEARSFPFLVGVMSLAFYPYVYLLVCVAFETMGEDLYEAAANLGLNPWQSFQKVALPYTKPFLIPAVMLVGMETLADFGTVSIFVFDTFATAIYKAWYGFFSPKTAAQLASFLVTLTFLLLVFERRFVGQRPLCPKKRPLSRRPLNGFLARGLLAFAVLIIGLGFLLPTTLLIYWAQSVDQTPLSWIGAVFWDSVLVASMASGLILCYALLFLESKRFFPAKKWDWLASFCRLGYAVPGSVLAIGLFWGLTWLEDGLVFLSTLIPRVSLPHGFLSTGLVVLVVGLFIRFLAVGYSPLKGGLERISFSMDQSAFNLGCRPGRLFTRVHSPLLKESLMVAFVLAFVDCLKEMPLTLMTRPFGWETFSIKIFQYTSEGDWQRAAIPALFLSLTGLLAALILAKREGL